MAKIVYRASMVYTYNPSTQEVEVEGQEFQAGLGCIAKSCLKLKKGKHKNST
jgi:hypothetical protein